MPVTRCPEPGRAQAPLTRRRFLRSVAAAGLGVAYAPGRAVAAPPPLLPGRTVDSSAAIQRFRSRPDLLPPGLVVAPVPRRPGYMFLGPVPPPGGQPGVLIATDRGDPVWFQPAAKDWVSDLRVTTYQGEPVLTWWEGRFVPPGYGSGVGIVLDRSYRPRALVRAGNGRSADLHEMLLTPQGTALVTCTPLQTEADLSAVGGPRKGTVLESVFQEIDVASGRVLLEWHSLDQVAVGESYRRPVHEPYDYLHINSLAVLPDGNLLMSARHTWTVYKLDRRTGAIIWRLGGKRSDFAMGPGTQFHWQHDARPVGNGVLSVFDDGSDGITNSARQSRALLLDVDERRRRVTLRRAYTHPHGLLATAMGSMQVLADGDVVVGWGTEPYLSQFSAGGHLIGDAGLPLGRSNYRGFRFDWRGAPADEGPVLAGIRDRRTAKSTLYASWNGATDVASWVVRLGPSATSLKAAGIARRAGFETEIAIGRAGNVAAVTALDRHGRPLGSSATVRL